MLYGRRASTHGGPCRAFRRSAVCQYYVCHSTGECFAVSMLAYAITMFRLQTQQCSEQIIEDVLCIDSALDNTLIRSFAAAL